MKKWLKVLALCLPLIVALNGCNQVTPPTEDSNVVAPEEVPAVEETAPVTEEVAPAAEEVAPATEEAKTEEKVSE